MHETLNIDENKNQLHSLLVNRETNLLILVIFIIGQYLSQTNESAKILSHLNKA
jgi:hypothetical protein